MSREFIYNASKFFRAGNIFHKFYDLYLKQKNLVLVYMGETYRSFLLRASDPGYSRRQKLKELTSEEIIKKIQKNIIVSRSEITNIELVPPTFFKNTKVVITTDQQQYTLYTENKEIDLTELEQVLASNQYPVH